MITVAILSDSHGDIHPQIIELINRCDFAVHAGDIIDESILKNITPKQRLIAVQGNNDPHMTFLNEVESLDLPGGKLIVEHGHKHGHHQPCHDSLRKTHPNAKAVVYGHTHVQTIDKNNTPWVINPGASGGVRNQGGPRCLILTIDDEENWEFESHVFN
jgi:uncharacterized protein